MAAIIASVAPQVTVMCLSGSMFIPLNQAYFSARLRRTTGVPQVTAYWLMSSRIALTAASLISSGAGKSGKPCERLIPP